MRNILITLCSLALLLTACTQAAPSAPSAGLHVLAAETFLGDIAQNVAGERQHIEVLLTPGVDPHEFQLTPQDAVKISESDVLIVNGFGYETWLEKSGENSGNPKAVITTTAGLTPEPDPSGEHPAGDPHMWMDPLKVIHYVENIRDGLTKADAGGRDVYNANADAYIERLKDLDAQIKRQVAQLPAEKRLLVTNHDALGYFAEAYGFQVVGLVIPSVSNDASPSAKQMAELIDTIQRTGAPAIFLDVSENQNLARQIASATGAKVVTDIYVETLSEPSGPAPSYLEMIEHDVSEIIMALQ